MGADEPTRRNPMKVIIDMSTVENFDEADSVHLSEVFTGATGFLIMTEIGEKCGLNSHMMSGSAIAASIDQIFKMRPDVKFMLAQAGTIKLGKMETIGLMAEMIAHRIRGGAKPTDDDMGKWK